MARTLPLVTLLVGVLAFAPWAVYLGGLAKLTDVVTNGNLSQAYEQTIIMLEWYTVAAQFANIIFLIIACAVPRGLARSHTFLNGFFMCNAALIIYRATVRITQINAISDGVQPSLALKEGIFPYPFTGNPQPYLKAEVAGQITSAAWNFFLVILISVAATGPDMEPTPPHAS